MKRPIATIGLLVGAALSACVAFGPASAGGKKSDAEVKVNVQATKPDGAGKFVVTVNLDINKGWHVYSNPVGNDDLAAAQTIVKVSGTNKLASVKIDYPAGQIINDKILGKYGVYEDKVAIKATVQRAAGDTGPLAVTVRFQACNDKGSCLFPATLKFDVK